MARRARSSSQAIRARAKLSTASPAASFPSVISCWTQRPAYARQDDCTSIDRFSSPPRSLNRRSKISFSRLYSAVFRLVRVRKGFRPFVTADFSLLDCVMPISRGWEKVEPIPDNPGQMPSEHLHRSKDGSDLHPHTTELPAPMNVLSLCKQKATTGDRRYFDMP